MSKMSYGVIMRFLFLVFVSFSLQSCFPPATSTLVGGQYEAKTNTTEYFIFPLGSVSLPGQWVKGNYNSVSGQQWFKKDSISLAIAFTQCDKYEFSKKDLKDFNFVKEYYEWDSKYLADTKKLTRQIIVSDSVNQYIIWRLFGDNFDNHFLFGNKNCAVHNYNVATKKWTEEEKVQFLQRLYLKKN